MTMLGLGRVTMRDYVDTQVAHARELDTLRDTHARELAEAVEKGNAQHFEILNKNAERTIEERGHFVTHEAFDPFKEAVLKAINANTGGRQMLSWLIAGGSLLVAIAAVMRK